MTKNSTSPNTLTNSFTILSSAHLQGLVIAAYGKRYLVEIDGNQTLSCVTRGKKTDLACGDTVQISPTAHDEGVVESASPRTSLLYRSSAYKSKLLAANVSQAVIVLATQPSFYPALLDRCLVACEAANIQPLIVLNKCDLADEFGAHEKLATYEKIGYRVLKISAKQAVNTLSDDLQHHSSVLVGQSGMGKSTIINALLPEAKARTQEVSIALDSGKHTTTAAHLYHLNAHSHLIDSPGLQEFGVNHVSQSTLEYAFPEFRPFIGHCRFNNCRHLHEPDCAILSALNQAKINPQRMAHYQAISQELAS